MKVKRSRNFSINNACLNRQVKVGLKTLIFTKISQKIFISTHFPSNIIYLQKLLYKLKHTLKSKSIKSKLAFKTLNHMFKKNYSIIKREIDNEFSDQNFRNF